MYFTIKRGPSLGPTKAGQKKINKIQSICLRTPSPAVHWRKSDLLGVALTGGLGHGLPGTSVTAEPQWPPRHSASFNLSRKHSGSKQSPFLWFQTTPSSNRPGFRISLGLKERPEEATSSSHDKLPSISLRNCNDFQKLLENQWDKVSSCSPWARDC